MTNKKPLTGAQRVAASVERYRAAGLVQVKIWTHPDEAEAVRMYAAKKPLTKAIREALKYENQG